MLALLNALLTRNTATATSKPADGSPARDEDIDKAWNDALATAISDRDRAEIDAIFSRALRIR